MQFHPHACLLPAHDSHRRLVQGDLHPRCRSRDQKDESDENDRAAPNAVSSGQPVNQPHTARPVPPTSRPAARSVTGFGRSAARAQTRPPPRPRRPRSHPTLRTTATSRCGGRAPVRRESGRRRARRRDVRGAPRRRDSYARVPRRRAGLRLAVVEASAACGRRVGPCSRRPRAPRGCYGRRGDLLPTLFVASVGHASPSSRVSARTKSVRC